MLILASQSPRRGELLKSAGIAFEARAAAVDESVEDGEDPEEYVKRLACAKAMAVQAAPGELVLGADTVVVIDGEILGKPKDATDAARMLRLLAGRKHQVMTGVCLRGRESVMTEWESTQVWVGTLSDSDIEDYVKSGEPMDKAGAYGIQGIASRFIERIDGSYSNVVGLPVAMVWKMLREPEQEPQ